MTSATKLTAEQAWDAICYHGDSVLPSEGEHDLRVLTAETVCLLPEDVQDWLLHETNHVFIGGAGQLGEYFPLYWFPGDERDKEYPRPEDEQNRRSGMGRLRIIFLSEKLMRFPKEEVFWTIAHEIAHSRLNHHGGRGGYEDERAADALVKAWGFTEPSGRAEDLELYR